MVLKVEPIKVKDFSTALKLFCVSSEGNETSLIFTCHYAFACQHHNGGEADGEDGALTEVQQGQSRGRLQRGRLVHLQETIIPLRLVLLIVEILKEIKRERPWEKSTKNY